MVPHLIVLAKLDCKPLQVWFTASLVLFLCRLHSLEDLGGDEVRLPFRALASSIDLVAQGCHWCCFLRSMRHDMLPTPQGGSPRSLVNSLTLIKEMIYRAFIQTT